MSDQMRFNAGKAELSYWLSTRMCLHIRETQELELSECANPYEAEHADMCLTGLSAWLLGEIDHHEYAAQFMESFIAVGLHVAEQYSAVCMRGAKKYARGNFRKGQTVTHYADSMARHLYAVSAGELVDPETECPHFAHALWNWVQIFEIMDQPEVAALRDDRLLHHGNLSGGAIPVVYAGARATTTESMSDKENETK